MVLKVNRDNQVSMIVSGNKILQHKVLLPLIVSFLILFSLWGCASLPEQRRVLALVDGDPLERADLEYALQIAHRREKLTDAGELDISSFVERLIDEKLIIQEAERMGMGNSADIIDKVNAYILRESVVLLFNNEVKGSVSASEDEVRQYYSEQYRKFTLGIIEVDSREKASTIEDLLLQGSQFSSLANEFSKTRLRDGMTELEFRNMKPFMQDVVQVLKVGDVSDIIAVDGHYYIVELVNEREAPEDGFGEARDGIEQKIKAMKAQKRSDEYLKMLRKKAHVKMNEDILSSMETDKGDEAMEKWAMDERLIVTGDTISLSVQEYVSKFLQKDKDSAERRLNNWVDRKLVDIEALSRNYAEQPGLREQVKRYKNQLIKNNFMNRVLAPQIKVSEEEIMDYYQLHLSDFEKPVEFRIQQITLNSEAEGEDAIQHLQQGADFAWVAKKMSQDATSGLGGMVGWVSKAKLPEEAREVVSALEIGEVSPLLKIGDYYRIYRVQNKTDKAIKEFDEVKPLVYRKLSRDKFAKLYQHYLEGLKKEAEIIVYDKEVKAVRQMFRN